ncbi:MAG: endonuclease/exonuclease/phosphatase family protein [Bacteroidales bacterium]|jgi:exonuclease III|nr:endonuclease/exonuclease/phosphatase family protein [Bacteroidales bacterium]
MYYHNMKPKKKTKVGRIRQLATLLCVLPHIVLAQKEVILFHNCENFFYPTNDSIKDDDEFTINGRKHWTWARFEKKRDMLAKTYIAAGQGEYPAIIGLCEVEGNKVLDALCFDSPLRKGGYKYIHYPSQDVRGIDVALLYNESKFKILHSKQITPQIQSTDEPTRDVLYVKGTLNKTFNINIYVIHAPSRREQNIKQQLRENIFTMIKNDIDSLRQEGEENFLVMGDLNDNPWDESVVKGLQTEITDTENEQYLTNLMQGNQGKTGSYYYGGDLLSFDQFLVSPNFKSKIFYPNQADTTHIFKPQFLRNNDPRVRLEIPHSTYRRFRYAGGVSDHFPIILHLEI